jgi:hypothetical protein
MVARFPDLTMPTSAPPTGSPGNVPNINWVVLQPEQRYVLVVDRSGSMAGAKLREAQSGCHWWVDNAVIGDVLGSVSFASSASVDHSVLPLQNEGERQPHHDAIQAWSAAGQTAIGGALRTALDEIVGLGPRAATQVAVLLTDGLQTTGEAVSSVIPDVLAAGVRVYVIAVGPTIDEPMLSNLALRTGGRFARIDPTLSEADQAFAVRTALEELSLETRDSGGIVTSSEASSEPGTAVQRSVTIEQGCMKATFLVSRRNFKDDLSFRLLDPQGRSISASALGSAARLVSNVDQSYEAIQVLRPRAGVWKISVRAGTANPKPARFRLLVGVENPSIGTALYPLAPSYQRGETVELHLRAFAPMPITGLRIRANIAGPDMKARGITFADDGRRADAVPDDGVYTSSFPAPSKPGTYMVRAQVEIDRRIAKVGGLDDPGDRFRSPRGAVRSFRRVVETSFVVLKS